MNLWHGLVPMSEISILHKKKLRAFRIWAKLVKWLLASLHSLYVVRCYLTHTNASCDIAIEELNDLKEDMSEVLESSEYSRLVADKEIKVPRKSSEMTTSQVKWSLFNYYSAVDNYDRYDNLNANSVRYREKWLENLLQIK